jgi:hypothetical protein
MVRRLCILHEEAHAVLEGQCSCLGIWGDLYVCGSEDVKREKSIRGSDRISVDLIIMNTSRLDSDTGMTKKYCRRPKSWTERLYPNPAPSTPPLGNVSRTPVPLSYHAKYRYTPHSTSSFLPKFLRTLQAQSPTLHQ